MNRYLILVALTALLASSAAFAQDQSSAQQQNQSPALQHISTAAPEQPQWKGHHHWRAKNFCLFILICLIVHILTAVWVYQDIKIRHVGSGIWVVIALLTGLLGTFVYAVVRLGDTTKPTT